MQDKYKEVAILLFAGTFLFLILGGIVIFVLLFYQKKRFRHRQQMLEVHNSIQQELLRTQLETQEATYQQIGEEIHDNIGQLLSTAKVLLNVAQLSLPKIPESLHAASMTIGKAMHDLRSLSKSLNKEWLQQFNIADNLRAEIDRLNAASSIQTRLQLPADSLPMTPEAQIVLFRVIQEAIQNAIKHGNATSILVQISLVEDKMGVIIRDDGNGFNPNEHAITGMGLKNMENRTRMLGGDIKWISSAGQGAEVNIAIPIDRRLL